MQHSRSSMGHVISSDTHKGIHIHASTLHDHYDADLGKVVFYQPAANERMVFDTDTGIPEPPFEGPVPFRHPPNPEYPALAVPVDVMLPAKGDAINEKYAYVGSCITEPVRLISRESGNVIATLTATGQRIELYCNGERWIQSTDVSVEP